MVFITNDEYKELLEIKFKYELEHNTKDTCDCEKTVEEFETVEETKEEPREFKVGDKVEVTSDIMNELGTIGTIIHKDNTSVPYKVKFDDGHTTWYSEEYIKLVEEREEK